MGYQNYFIVLLHFKGPPATLHGAPWYNVPNFFVIYVKILVLFTYDSSTALPLCMAKLSLHTKGAM